MEGSVAIMKILDTQRRLNRNSYYFLSPTSLVGPILLLCFERCEAQNSDTPANTFMPLVLSLIGGFVGAAFGQLLLLSAFACTSTRNHVGIIMRTPPNIHHYQSPKTKSRWFIQCLTISYELL